MAFSPPVVGCFVKKRLAKGRVRGCLAANNKEGCKVFNHVLHQGNLKYCTIVPFQPCSFGHIFAKH